MLEYHVIAVTLTSMSIPTKSPEAQASSDSDLRASLARTGMLRATLTTILRWFQASQNQDKVRHQASLDGWTRCRRPGYSATYRSCWMLDTGVSEHRPCGRSVGKPGHALLISLIAVISNAASIGQRFMICRMNP